MLKILITGNMGYVGPILVRRLRDSYQEAELIGLDLGYFGNCLSSAGILPECRVNRQYFADVRNFSDDVLTGVDAVVYLAALSNDPLGHAFEEATLDINYRACIRAATKAKEAGVKSFAYASSCSVYGYAEDGARTEESAVNPLTAYAKSKVWTERDLASLADRDFRVTCLRFATACGMSDRLRLDLVLNDFVAGALASKKITILSDGTPWRPLIHIKDMARAIDWAIRRDPSETDSFLVVNVGCDQWNYQVKDLAEAVAQVIPGVEISINKNAQPDKRSYRVSFEKFKQLAPGYTPQVDLLTAIREVSDGLTAIGFSDENFRQSKFIRLNTLMQLRERGLLTPDLRWISAGERLRITA
ncbi:MAG: NAD-dependent epimerase/dehydratase family protein [Alphaproteobacteria bacterium]